MNRLQTIQEIFDNLGQFKRVLHLHFMHNFANLNLSPAQLELLRTIQSCQPVSHKALAAKAQLSPSAVSQLLDGLDHAGCIVRTANLSDRRISYVSLSRIGKHKLQDLQTLRQRIFTNAFEALTDNELDVYLSAQQKLIMWLEDNQPIQTK